MDMIQEFGYLRAMLQKEFIVFSRYPILIISTFLTPIFLVLIFAYTSLAFVPDPNEGDLETIATMMYIGILSYVFLNIAVTAAITIRDEQQQGTLEGLFLTPATKITNVVAKLLVQIIVTSFNAITLYIAILIFIAPLNFANLPLVIFLIVMLLLQFIGLGFLLAGLTLKLKETIVLSANLFTFLIMIFSSMFYTFDTIPVGPIRWISYILPTSYAVDAIRSALLDYPPGFPELTSLGVEILITILSALFFIVIGIWVYMRIERSSRKLGTLLEY
ncbi:MAG: ABC transporter permease [Candidatus Kariarchaeaceae archaeon]|jgi:ABC-2 type transport system permease protein